MVLRLVSGRHEDRVPRRPHGKGAPIQPKLDFDLGPKPKFILTSVAAVRCVNGYFIGLLAEGRNRGGGSLPSVYLIPRPLRQPF